MRLLTRNIIRPESVSFFPVFILYFIIKISHLSSLLSENECTSELSLSLYCSGSSGVLESSIILSVKSISGTRQRLREGEKKRVRSEEAVMKSSFPRSPPPCCCVRSFNIRLEIITIMNVCHLRKQCENKQLEDMKCTSLKIECSFHLNGNICA
jgi:hypothetical protein